MTNANGSRKIHIALAGLIGAGKSTLAANLGKELGVPVYYEQVAENKYLEDFYRDPKQHGFALQVYLLKERFKQQQRIVWSQEGGIADRSIYEDGVFARMLRDGGMMDARDYETYCDLFAQMSNFMRHPDVLVYLDLSPERSLERIKKRGRHCERTITLEYLRALHTSYTQFIAEISRVIPVIRVDWDEFHDTKRVAAAILACFDDIKGVHDISMPS